MTRISADWLTSPATSRVFSMLNDAGHAAFAVGGCVRNTLLGAPVSDVDIATSARPDRVLDIAAAAAVRAIPTGIDHGTVTVVVNGQPFEITTFRKDIATDGRRAAVVFADTMEADARRRDFTMNALYADPAGTVHDPVGGLPDLRNRRVRFIDDPGERIREDYLRTLRFFRFHAWYGDPAQGVDPEALAAIAANLDGLERLSRERVGAEMKKLLAAADPAPAVAAMQQTGALARFLPGADTRALAPLIHLEDGAPPDALRRLAALGGEDVADLLRLSRAEARRLRLLHELVAAAVTPEEIAYRHGAVTAIDVALLRAALLETPLPADLAARADAAAAQTFPLRAADLAGRFQGPALGRALRQCEQRWIDSGFRLTRDELLRPAAQ